MDTNCRKASLAALRAFPDAVSISRCRFVRRDGTAKLAGEVDYLAASERFAWQASDVTDLHSEANQRECVRRLRQRYSTIVVVTMGERGLVADDGNGFFHLPAFPAESCGTPPRRAIFFTVRSLMR